MINTWGKEEITKLNYEFRQDGIYDKKTSKKICSFRAGGEGSGKRLPCLRPPESFLYVSRWAFIFFSGRSDERRRTR